MIKFRVWDKLTDTVQDVLDINFKEKTVTVSQKGIVWHKHDNLRSFEDVILMQSTGLKDKNGVEIFEGDIVLLTSKSINYSNTFWHNYAEVFQQPNGAYRLRGKGIYETELYGNRKQVTLTGNIYETPELLGNDRFCTETDDPDY